MRAFRSRARWAAAVWPLLLGFALISCTQRAPNGSGIGTAPGSPRSSTPGAPPPGGSATPSTRPPAAPPGDNGSAVPQGAGAPPAGNGNGDRPIAPDQNAPGSERGAPGSPQAGLGGAAGHEALAGSAPGAASAAAAAGYRASGAARFLAGDTAPAKPAANGVSAEPKVVEAVLEPANGSKVHGRVEFTARDSVLVIDATVSGLTPGKHGIHVHENGDCSAHDAGSAGGHFNPDGHTHGGPASAIHHAGDLGNLEAMSNGTAKKEVVTSDLSLSGRYGVIGRAVVVHADADDYHTNPAGNSGERVACGVIRETTAAEAHSEAQGSQG